TAREPPASVAIGDPETEIASLIACGQDAAIDGVISTDDYPGSTLASIVAERLQLPGVRPRANLLCQHKFYSRELQRCAVPEAVPDFESIDVSSGSLSLEQAFPIFVKPVKSFFSVGAQCVYSAEELARIRQRWKEARLFFQPFETLFRKYTGL